MMRKDAGNTYGLVPRRLVAMLSHDGTAWFVDEGAGITLRSLGASRSKTPPPTYEIAINGEGKEEEDVPMNDIMMHQERLDLLSQDNVEGEKQKGSTLLMEGTLKYRKETQHKMKQDQFRLTTDFKLQSDVESIVINESVKIKQSASMFELVIDGNRTFHFDAGEETSRWVQRIKYLISIQSILQRTPTAHLYVPLLDAFQRISTLPGNNLCADCGERDPSVASLAHAVMLCEECGVVHARMGRRVQRFKVPNAQNAKCLIFVEHVMRGVEGNVNVIARSNQTLAQNASRLDRTRHVYAKYKRSTGSTFETLSGDLNTAIRMTINSNKRPGFNPNAQHRLTLATNLHLHVRENNLAVVALLMFMGADPMIEDEVGLSALELSIQLEHLEAAEIMAREWQLRHSTSTVNVL